MKYLEILEQTLNEINMSPSSLRQAAANIEALAGMEFEMIIPGVGSGDSEPEWEADWDRDERTRSFSDIRDFFHDGDYNGRRAVDDLMDEIDSEYSEWKQEQITDSWDSEGLDYLRDYIANNDSFDRDGALDAARDEIMDANPDLPPESEEFSQLLSARLDEMEQEFVQQEFDNKGSIYDEAFEEFSDEKQSEDAEEEFLDERYPYMTDIQNNFDISWPHYYDLNDGQDGDIDVEQVGDEFSSFMGKPVNASRSYHGGKREAGTYVVEPDGSLEGDNPGDGGLEFVSPPMPIDEMLADLKKVKAWADKTGAYTNDSTGLHINVSVPGFSMEKLDFVKLAIMLGDERVLNEFGRMGNTYTKSALQIVKQNIQQRPEDAEALLNKMKEHLSTAAAKSIHSGVTSKYTSINTKTGYIEFRSPGGDWLDANFELIEPTLLRFVVALDAALDETKYQTEYAKKLYKLLAPGSKEPGILELFANYSAGELDKAALIRQIRQKQLARDVGTGKAKGKMWWSVSRPGYFASIEVVANSKEEAIDKALEPGNYPDWASSRNTLQAKPLRPYQEKPNGPTLNNRPSNPDGNYVIVSQEDESVPVYRFMASGDQDAISVLRQWISANPGLYRWTFKKDAEQRLGQPGAPAQPAADNQGNWGLWMAYNNRFIRQPGQIDYNVIRRFPSQAAAMAFLERTREENPNMRTDVEVREIPADYQLISTPAGRPVGPASQSAASTTDYEVFDRNTGATVDTFTASTDQEVARGLNNYRTMGPHNLTPEQAEQRYGLRRAGSTPIARQTQFQEPNAARGDLTPRGPGPWEIYRLSDNSSVRELNNTDRMAAGEEARNALGLRGEAPELYGVRTRQTQQTATGAFTGEWKIVDANDREIHRFGGVGNVQADANRIAMNWLRQNPRHMQSGVQVLPVMG